MIEVLPIFDEGQINEAFAIRRDVFGKEFNVRPEDERDEFEKVSHHFLATLNGKPVGTARWRRTSNGIKLERFAVRKKFRGQGIGKALVQAILDDIFSQQPEPIESIYLYAQVTAMPLYASFGFVPVGSLFEESGVQHSKMVLPASSFPHT